jgi:hypothetical protein
VEYNSSKKKTKDNSKLKEKTTLGKKPSEEKNRTIKMDGHQSIKPSERKIKKEEG